MNPRYQQIQHGMAPFHYVCENGQFDVEWTPFHYSCKNGWFDVEWHHFIMLAKMDDLM